VLVYPSWNNPPRLIGDLNTPHGNNSPRISPATGFPAMTVPMGFVRGTLPTGLQILGKPWSEATVAPTAPQAFASRLIIKHGPALGGAVRIAGFGNAARITHAANLHDLA
jgi:Asp-tRNA(Asn)/Glu-tRNA(Gln) amidotransferase A subunit family amidase